jgi:hypothetical protein
MGGGGWKGEVGEERFFNIPVMHTEMKFLERAFFLTWALFGLSWLNSL